MAVEPATRPRVGRGLGVLALLLLVLCAAPLVSAQERVTPSELGEPPTTGTLRPGPIGLDPRPFRVIGVRPVAIRIEKANVDAPVEEQEIIDGVMQDPSGPFVVSWYKETGRLGEQHNIVMAGHLDYWDVGAAVFYEVWKLEEGDVIEVVGEDDKTYRYAVEWVKSYKVAELGAKAVQEIVGRTSEEKLTLITCGGPFDYERGEYLERIVVRAERIND
ncbi:MAG TPA: class F sortase [Thermomicrobiales bacterium]